MNWIKESISWAHFVSVLRESVDELKKSISQHSSEVQQLRQQNQMLLQQSVQQANETQRLERKIESIEAHLRAPSVHSLTIDAVNQRPKLLPPEAKRNKPKPSRAP